MHSLNRNYIAFIGMFQYILNSFYVSTKNHTHIFNTAHLRPWEHICLWASTANKMSSHRAQTERSEYTKKCLCCCRLGFWQLWCRRPELKTRRKYDTCLKWSNIELRHFKKIRWRAHGIVLAKSLLFAHNHMPSLWLQLNIFIILLSTN